MEEITKLIEGYYKFHKKYFLEEDNKLFKDLSTYGQSPKILFVSCSDSRVDPSILTNSSPGDLFVIRNVANLIPKYQPDDNYHGVSAAIEFAVNCLLVKHIIIMGHSQCGGIKTLVENDFSKSNFEFINSWLNIAKEAKERLLISKNVSNPYIFCEQEAIKISLNNLLTFPSVKEKTVRQALYLHGWYFEIETGFLYDFDKKNNIFNIYDNEAS